jgi:hypothetical protein
MNVYVIKDTAEPKRYFLVDSTMEQLCHTSVQAAHTQNDWCCHMSDGHLSAKPDVVQVPSNLQKFNDVYRI